VIKTLTVVPLLLACNPTTPKEDTGDGLIRLASITGNVELAVPPSGDGLGTMVVILSNNSNSVDIMPHRIFVESLVIIETADFAMPFQLTNIFPQDEPYYIGAFFDEDFSMADQGSYQPNSGDLSSWMDGDLFDEIVLGSGEDRSLVITLIDEME
jgi:hypothetical protein